MIATPIVRQSVEKNACPVGGLRRVRFAAAPSQASNRLGEYARAAGAVD